MKKLFAVSIVAVACSMAFAENTDLAFRIGLAKPTTTGTGFDQFTSFGIQHRIRAYKSNESWNNFAEISADFYGRGDFRSIPLLYNYVGYSTKNDFFYSVGAGIAFTTRPMGGGTESIGRFAYQVGLGYNLTKGENSSFVEAKFFGNEARELNAFGLFLGVRF
jgi:hypothetical protein